MAAVSRSFSQAEFSKWYFGTWAGLDFSTSPPTALTNGTMIAPEGCATVSDAAGNLIIYSNGLEVYNSAHTLMANGTGLNGDISSAQAAMIIKKPASNNLYYIFTTNQSTGYWYSIIDMSLAAGLGSVTVKNVQLNSSCSEKQVAVRHCNGTDFWLVGHEVNSNNFFAYLFSATGVNTVAIISSVGEIPGGNPSSNIGHLKISPNGRILASVTYSNSTPIANGSSGFQLFNFDPTNGAVYNPIILLSNPVAQRPYGVEFSSDGTKLYGTALSATTTSGGSVYQWNVCLSSTAAIVGSIFSFSVPFSSLGTIQRAIDNKLYLTAINASSISVIHSPNNTGSAMGFSLNTIYLGGKQGRLGLPNWINPYVKSPPQTPSNTITCQSVSFISPSSLTQTAGCSPITYSYSSFLWDFGEPSAGAANSSTLSNPIHTYNSLGTYTVKLIMYSNCTSDTVSQVVTINTADPPITIAGKTSFCKGEKRTFIASGGTTYLWSDNSTNYSITVTPTITGVLGLTATANGCNVSKSLTLTVSDCVGLAETEINITPKIYPNPCSDKLNVDFDAYLAEPCLLVLRNIFGQEILRNECKGKTVLNLSELDSGCYLLESSNAGFKRCVKVVKE